MNKSKGSFIVLKTHEWVFNGSHSIKSLMKDPNNSSLKKSFVDH